MASSRRKKGFPWKIVAYVAGGLLALTLVLAFFSQGMIRDHFRQKEIRDLEGQLKVVAETITQLEDKVASEIERGEVIYTHELRKDIELYKANEETLRGQIEALKK